MGLTEGYPRIRRIVGTTSYRTTCDFWMGELMRKVITASVTRCTTIRIITLTAGRLDVRFTVFEGITVTTRICVAATCVRSRRQHLNTNCSVNVVWRVRTGMWCKFRCHRLVGQCFSRFARHFAHRGLSLSLASSCAEVQ